VLHRRLLQSNADKDILFDQRLSQLKDLMSEIKRFEKLIKDNANLVDNMILP
jgi:guanylate kinase